MSSIKGPIHPQPGRVASATTIAVGVIIFAGVLLRLFSATGELALDEIWSLKLLSSIGSASEIFTKIRHDNNHYLNSLYLFILGQNASPLLYRVHSLTFSILTVWLGAAFGKRRSAAEFVTLAILLSFSYVLVLFGSEARGYSSMLFFELAAFVVLCGLLEIETFGLTALFWLCICFAFLSHSTSLSIYGPMIVWTSLVTFRQGGWRFARRWFLKVHGVPLLFIAVFFLVFMRGLELGGGPQGSHLEVGLNTLGAVIGLPELSSFDVQASAWIFGGCLFVLVVLGVSAYQSLRAGDAGSVFFAIAVLGVPLVVVTILDPPVLFVRYFLGAILFSYVLLSRFLARLWSCGTINSRTFVVAFIAISMTSNLLQTKRLIVAGRGNYRAVLEKIVESVESSSPIKFGGFPDARNSILSWYFAPRTTGGKALEYVPEQYPGEMDVPWLVLQSQDSFQEPSFVLKNGESMEFNLVRGYDAASLSGIRLFLYCRADVCPHKSDPRDF